MRITYNPRNGLALFRGDGGFTQVRMTEWEANAIAQALHIPFALTVAA